MNLHKLLYLTQLCAEMRMNLHKLQHLTQLCAEIRMNPHKLQHLTQLCAEIRMNLHKQIGTLWYKLEVFPCIFGWPVVKMPPLLINWKETAFSHHSP